MAKYRGEEWGGVVTSRAAKMHFKTSQIFQCLAFERCDVIRITPFVSTQLVTSKWVMDDNDA